MNIPIGMKFRLWVEKRRRDRLKSQHRALFDGVTELLFKHDPMGVNFEENTDEYDPEAGTIIPRLRGCTSEFDVLKVVYDEFGRWFGPELIKAGPRYEGAAREIWELYQREVIRGQDT